MNITETTPMIEPLLRPCEVARILQISKAQVYRMLQAGEIPAVKFSGKTVRVQRNDLQQFIDQSRSEKDTK